ncbi:MAG: TonB-dependent receptor [Pseudomonadota bacterium]
MIQIQQSLARTAQVPTIFQAPYLFKTKPIVLVLAAFFTPSLYAADAQIDLPALAVTGNPLGVGSDELVVPVSVLNGRELSLRREGTLGETLNGIPGVTATQFGPNASRPVIRGLDGERVRIMQNGIGILDASSLSFDHAVGVDPLVIEQIDVVRGPAALLYGGSAVGGVVNAIDHRIPKEQLDGATGRAEARFGGPDSTRNGAAVIDVGNGQFAIHADVYSRKTSDLDIDGFAVSKRKNAADGTPRENRGKLVNSSSEGDGGALGAALTFDNGYIGASFSTLNNNYGVVAEEAVRIDMKSDRWDVATEFTDLGNVINRIKFRMAHTDYEHRELEDGEVGTTFLNRGIEGSLEAGHAKINLGNGLALNGVVGFQFNNTNFEALGDEAFVPGVNTQNKALYVYEELPLGDKAQHKITFGGRLGHATVDSKTNINFGAGQNNSFNPNSYALGGLYSINENWSLTSNLSHNERAPSYFELYANGAHVATGQFEVGNTNFKEEKSNGVDAQVRWKDAKNAFSLGAYYTRFSNFIGLFETGNLIGPPGEELPEAQFRAVPAVFKGLEFEGKVGLTDQLTLNLRGDYVHAKEKRTNEYLPRIAPLRLGAGLQYQLNSFTAKLDVLRAFKQDNTANIELATDGYTNVSVLVAYKLPTKLNLELFAKANNLLNDEIREHASFLKDISPAGERSLLIGLRGDF